MVLSPTAYLFSIISTGSTLYGMKMKAIQASKPAELSQPEPNSSQNPSTPNSRPTPPASAKPSPTPTPPNHSPNSKPSSLNSASNPSQTKTTSVPGWIRRTWPVIEYPCPFHSRLEPLPWPGISCSENYFFFVDTGVPDFSIASPEWINEAEHLDRTIGECLSGCRIRSGRG